MVFRIALVLVMLVPSIQEPVTQPFIGSWDLDGFYPRLPFGFHGDRAVCGARYTSALQHQSDVPIPVAESEQVPVGTINGTLTLSADSKQLVIERRYTGSAGDVSFKGVYSLDGSDTTSTSDGVIFRAKAAIAGQKLTLSGVVTSSNPKESLTCSLKEVFEVSGNALKVTTVGEANGDQLWSFQTYFKK